MTVDEDDAGTASRDVATGWQEIDPWGGAPHLASRIAGLGGGEPSPDPAYVFGTAFFVAEPGPLHMRIVFEGHRPSDAAFLLEISNRSDIPGSPPVRHGLRLAPLDAIADGEGRFDLSFAVDQHVEYALAAFLHTDHDLPITGLRVFVDRPVALAEAGEQRAFMTQVATRSEPAAIRDTGRLMGNEAPSFTNPYSQPWTASQQREPAFLARCTELGLNRTDADAWAEAFVLQVLVKYGALLPERSGIGFDCTGQALPWHLASRAARVLITRLEPYGTEANLGSELTDWRSQAGALTSVPDMRFTTLVPNSLPQGYFGAFDFAWWIAPSAVSLLDIRLQVHAIATALKPQGIAVVILPFHPAVPAPLLGSDHADVITRPVIERLALDIISEGNSVAQLRFGRLAEWSDASRFGMVVART